MELFTLDEKGMPIANPAILIVKSFHTLMKRLKPIEGDFNGAKKTHNLRELAYVYFTTKHDSRFKLLDEKEKDKKIKEFLQLPDSWEPDEVVKECITWYRDSQVTASSELVLSLEGMAMALAQYMKNAKDNISRGNLTTVDPKTIKDIISVIDSIPDTISNIEKAKVALRSELDELKTGKKGRKLNIFELPE